MRGEARERIEGTFKVLLWYKLKKGVRSILNLSSNQVYYMKFFGTLFREGKQHSKERKADKQRALRRRTITVWQ